jgi:hypothetical protein
MYAGIRKLPTSNTIKNVSESPGFLCRFWVYGIIANVKPAAFAFIGIRLAQAVIAKLAKLTDII